MKRIFAVILLGLGFLYTNQCISQKPVKEIPKDIRDQMVQVFMNTYYDSTIQQKDRTEPTLTEKDSSYVYKYDGSLGGDFVGFIAIPKEVLYGDMNGDGINEMIITPTINNGGNWCFENIFLFAKKNNRWILKTYFEEMDRFLQSQYIENRILYGTILEYDSDDPHCCPTLQTKIWYKYDSKKNKLVEVGKKVLKKIK